MQQLLNVKAGPGLAVPMEDKPRAYIGDSAPVQVPDSAYYQRRLQDGDLVQVPVADVSTSAVTTTVKTGVK